MPAQPANNAVDVDELLTSLATRFANEQGVSKTDENIANIASQLRWEPRPDRNPPAVVIMRRGAKKKGVSNVLAVISADPQSKYSDLYPSWVPVLAKWQAKRIANSVSRVSHDDFPMGDAPK